MLQASHSMLAYLFDIDGTILLTGGAGTRAINRVFQERHGVPGAMDPVQPGGKTDPLIITEIFELKLGRSPSEAEIQEIFEAYVPYLATEIRRSERFLVMPGAPEAVRWLRGRPGVHLGIATGNIRDAARLKLEHIDLWAEFSFGGYGSDSADRAELVARAMERGREQAGAAGLADREFVVVGDTPRDVDAARACGARIVAVPTGRYGADELAACQPDALLDSLEQLPDWHSANHDGEQ